MPTTTQKSTLRVTRDACKAELAAIRTAQAAMTSVQRQRIDYWSGGGVNQLMPISDLPS